MSDDAASVIAKKLRIKYLFQIANSNVRENNKLRTTYFKIAAHPTAKNDSKGAGPRYSHPISDQHVIDQEDGATLTVNELPHLGDHHRPLADRRGYALDRSRAHVTHCEHAGLRGSKRRRN